MAKKRLASKTKSAPTYNPLAGQAFLHSLGVVAYTTVVAIFMRYGGQLTGEMDHSILGPVVFLLVFSLSAAVVGSLVFGRPVMLFLDGKKRDAVQLVGATIGFLAVEAIILLVALGLSTL